MVHHPSLDPTANGPALGERLGLSHAAVRFVEAPRAESESTWVFDDGRLARAFERPVSDSDVEAVLALLEDEPAFPELLAETGRRELREGRFRPCSRPVRPRLRASPLLAWVRGQGSRARRSDARISRKQDTRVVEVDPDYALGWYNLGIARTSAGRTRRAAPRSDRDRGRARADAPRSR